MKQYTAIASNRREYGQISLKEENMAESPLVQFEQWFDEATLSETLDPTAMTLSTVDHNGRPDSRVVLLKGIENNAFVFYTNYKSVKSIQLEAHAYAALNFYWPTLVRQVRVRGSVVRVSESVSDAYFASRPKKSQCSAIASHQSQVIMDRDVLETEVDQLMQLHACEVIKRPAYWGGFAVSIDEIEFWQGRDSRLHDRILYVRDDKLWKKSRLAP